MIHCFNNVILITQGYLGRSLYLIISVKKLAGFEILLFLNMFNGMLKRIDGFLYFIYHLGER